MPQGDLMAVSWGLPQLLPALRNSVSFCVPSAAAYPKDSGNRGKSSPEQLHGARESQ